MYSTTFELINGNFVLTVDASVWSATQDWLVKYGVEFAKYVRSNGTVKFTFLSAPTKVVNRLLNKFNTQLEDFDKPSPVVEIEKPEVTFNEVQLQVWGDGYAKLKTPCEEIAKKYARDLDKAQEMVGGLMYEESGNVTVLIWGLSHWVLERMEKKSYIKVMHM